MDPRTPAAGLWPANRAWIPYPPRRAFGPQTGGGSSCPLGRPGFAGKTGALESYFNVPVPPTLLKSHA
jgi:hypothetical protein